LIGGNLAVADRFRTPIYARLMFFAPPLSAGGWWLVADPIFLKLAEDES
jgi:hypothetical protein